MFFSLSCFIIETMYISRADRDIRSMTRRNRGPNMLDSWIGLEMYQSHWSKISFYCQFWMSFSKS